MNQFCDSTLYINEDFDFYIVGTKLEDETNNSSNYTSSVVKLAENPDREQEILQNNTTDPSGMGNAGLQQQHSEEKSLNEPRHSLAFEGVVDPAEKQDYEMEINQSEKTMKQADSLSKPSQDKVLDDRLVTTFQKDDNTSHVMQNQSLVTPDLGHNTEISSFPEMIANRVDQNKMEVEEEQVLKFQPRTSQTEGPAVAREMSNRSDNELQFRKIDLEEQGKLSDLKLSTASKVVQFVNIADDQSNQINFE